YCTGWRHASQDLTIVAQPVLPSGERTLWTDTVVCGDGSGTSPHQPDVDSSNDYGHGPNGVLASVLIPRDSEPGWVLFDVTAAVIAWESGALENHGIRLAHTPEGDPYVDGMSVFAAAEYAEPTARPILLVAYDPPQDGG